MKTRTIKLCSHKKEAEFYLQVEAAEAPLIISRGKTNSFGSWDRLYGDLSDTPDFVWEEIACKRKYPLSYNLLVKRVSLVRQADNTDMELKYMEWIANLLLHTKSILREGEPLSITGKVEEIVT